LIDINRNIFKLKDRVKVKFCNDDLIGFPNAEAAYAAMYEFASHSVDELHRQHGKMSDGIFRSQVYIQIDHRQIPVFMDFAVIDMRVLEHGKAGEILNIKRQIATIWN
jgi:hypothetical protein